LTKTATTRPESSNDKSDSESDGKGSGLDTNTETELANTVSTVANTLAISSLLARAGLAAQRRQLLKKSKPAPARKHQGQISQVLQKGKGKAVQKAEGMWGSS
jgi:hypothetical protein